MNEDQLWEMVMNIVKSQAEDPAIWFETEKASEYYLQNQLRKLHYVIEYCVRERGMET